MEFVYFIREQNKIKIGLSSDPEKRLKTFQTGTPNKLFLMHTIPGNRELEQYLHHLFQGYHLHNEWFSYTGSLREFINKQYTISTPTSIKKPPKNKIKVDYDLTGSLKIVFDKIINIWHYKQSHVYVKELREELPANYSLRRVEEICGLLDQRGVINLYYGKITPRVTYSISSND